MRNGKPKGRRLAQLGLPGLWDGGAGPSRPGWVFWGFFGWPCPCSPLAVSVGCVSGLCHLVLRGPRFLRRLWPWGPACSKDLCCPQRLHVGAGSGCSAGWLARKNWLARTAEALQTPREHPVLIYLGVKSEKSLTGKWQLIGSEIVFLTTWQAFCPRDLCRMSCGNSILVGPRKFSWQNFY